MLLLFLVMVVVVGGGAGVDDDNHEDDDDDDTFVSLTTSPPSPTNRRRCAPPTTTSRRRPRGYSAIGPWLRLHSAAVASMPPTPLSAPSLTILPFNRYVCVCVCLLFAVDVTAMVGPRHHLPSNVCASANVLHQLNAAPGEPAGGASLPRDGGEPVGGSAVHGGPRDRPGPPPHSHHHRQRRRCKRRGWRAGRHLPACCRRIFRLTKGSNKGANRTGHTN